MVEVNRRVVIGSDGEGLAGYAELVGEIMARDDTGLYLCGGHVHVLRRTSAGSVEFDIARGGKIAAILQDARRTGRYVAAEDKNGKPKMLPDPVIRLAMETFRDIAREEKRIVYARTKFPIMVRSAAGKWSAFKHKDAGVHVGVFVSPDARYVDVPDVASEEQFKKLVGTVMRPFREFEFADKRHKALVLAAVLMACTRTTMRSAPAVMIEAPIPRSGKTLFAETLGMLTPNRDDDGSIATSIPDKEEELEKKLAAFAGDGSDAVLFDNLRSGLYSAALESLVTAGTVTVRPMGQNDAMVTREFRALLMFTGNNASVSDDMRRRSLNIRIDAKTGRPQDIRHDFDPREKATEMRGEIAAAAIGLLEFGQTGDVQREQWMRDVSPDFADLIAPVIRLACDAMPGSFEWPDKVVDEALSDKGGGAVVEAILRGFVDSPHLIAQAEKTMRVADMLVMPPFSTVRDMLEGRQPPQRYNANTLGRFLQKLRDNPSDLGTLRRVKKSQARDTVGWRVEFSDAFRAIIVEKDSN
ncbi:hypothetical protein AX768_07045 [Burkholderia sp. PAMC 28687]|uniref:hypothetical protein n=1 Tax=Burkholderia sp. PAMC 28687 TaxID=1795874 RepID=UPI000784CFB1|nr:hypothetical protein [Burkholderia sp. PAMC 28687]AMM13893.1 hypothetical protein AX768_07045 [Burkholderia sp. PAMC 28687]